MTQLNTPYPSTAYLTGFLREQGVQAVQADLALALVLRLLSADGLGQVKAAALAQAPRARSQQVQHFLAEFDRYQATVDRVVAFLQGRGNTLAHRIANRSLLPEGKWFATLDQHPDDGSGDPLGWAFGALGLHDRARHLATLYLNDLADVLKDAVDPRFEFVRYGEKLAAAQASFEPLAQALAEPAHLIDQLLIEETKKALALYLQATNAIDDESSTSPGSVAPPRVALLSVPFPGSVYAAFRIAQTIKATDPAIVTVLGGGYVNTELRELADPRVFDFFDFVTLDAGERPLLALLAHLNGQRSRQRLVRTFYRDNGTPQADPSGEQTAPATADTPPRVVYANWQEPDVPFEHVGTPTWDGLPLDRYLSLLDMLNPMNRLWSDGRWNKLTVAHGCYWKKCSFCDVSLDYIGRYETATATTLVDRIEKIVAETGQTGFHFVDEAAPPKVLRALAEELIRRNVGISWWGNIRFEKSFSPELCELLADSGCIAISGGLEVASDRLLKLMKKGVDVAQVARVTRAFTDAGVLVHAYLMYGFPTQTVQDTVDALEYVRQLFENGCIQSGFWHRFTCTVHSPVGKHPAEYGVTLHPLPEPPTGPNGQALTFARNDVGFTDPSGVDHDTLGLGLKKAIYNYMHGMCQEDDVRRFFSMKVPKPTVKRDFVARALHTGK
ncbi:MAG TPA: B12-binding domain-containing radical SAM protein [Burkholderiaceae bacterium]|nr:B12-binding domain-containing radical SAM protein [Burkholderiaceae bacterium]